jgi:ATP-dependent RNA helicase SUPV3L1/SUV3
MQSSTNDTKITAILGPTNTGKTYLAMDRLLGHSSGMIGFPLRLLARENYERALALKGSRQVALITGEEKIIPAYATYFFCTVEAMPVSKQVDFLAVDEIQMCSDRDRGHIYTHRLLHARGRQETMFMGSEAIRPLLKRLIARIEFVTRPRFSNLTYSGSHKTIRLPLRSAVVAFSTDDVYAVAELIRRQRGGAAIVMGALSPRTRNAQVAMFQNGDVDYLVATDAIGMGLNMNVTHIAFASLNKFDGISRRNLSLSEFSQIAGRAGRHMNDGTFGVTGEVKEFDSRVVEQIEGHQFDIIKQIQWRNFNLDFSSYENLLDSLNVYPNKLGLVKVPRPNDEKFLIQLGLEDLVRDRFTNDNSIQLLWDVCQIPDYRKRFSGNHVKLLSHIYQSLSDTGKLDAAWIAKEISWIDNTDGGIDQLMDRIANIRIWTYVSNRSDWLRDPEEWQVKTREIEDRLSDVLHERLTQRFVDRRTSVLVKKLKNKTSLQSVVNSRGDVFVEGHFVGQLTGFAFTSDTTDSVLAGRTLSAVACKALAKEVQRRVIELTNEPNSRFEINLGGKISWNRLGDRHFLAHLTEGLDCLRPKLKVVLGDLVDCVQKDKIEERLYTWLHDHIRHHLTPLINARDRNLTGAVRGLVFQLVESGGVLAKRQAIDQLKALNRKDYGILRHLGIKIGRREIFFPKLLRPKSAGLSALLWAIKNNIYPVPELPFLGRVSIIYDRSIPIDFMRVVGYRRSGDLLVRIDILDRVAGMLKSRSINGPFEISPQILNLLGCSSKHAVNVVCSFGYKRQKLESKPNETKVLLFVDAKRLDKSVKKKRRAKFSDLNGSTGLHTGLSLDASPFAKLKEMSSR